MREGQLPWISGTWIGKSSFPQGTHPRVPLSLCPSHGLRPRVRKVQERQQVPGDRAFCGASCRKRSSPVWALRLPSSPPLGFRTHMLSASHLGFPALSLPSLPAVVIMGLTPVNFAVAAATTRKGYKELKLLFCSQPSWYLWKNMHNNEKMHMIC